MKKTIKRISKRLSFGLIAAAFTLSLGAGLIQPNKAEAAITGSGNAQDPYVITTCTDLQNIGTVGDGSDEALYILAGDVNCGASSGWNSGKGFNPIENFDGTLDGRGHTISGLTINRPDESQVGLFAGLYDAMVANLTIDGTSFIAGNQNVGSIAGEMYEGSIIYGVKSSATVDAADVGGGLVGYTYGDNDTKFEKSAFLGSVTSESLAGGLSGYQINNIYVQDVMVNGSITGNISGGLFGNSNQSCADRTINNAAVYGTVDGSIYAGGLIGSFLNAYCGSNFINNSYSEAVFPHGTKGGLVGYVANSDLNIDNSFYEADNAANCIGLKEEDSTIDPEDCADIGSNSPSADPQDEPYLSWDYEDVWQDESGIETLQFPFDNLSGPTAPQDFAAAEGDNPQDIDVIWAAPASEGDYEVEFYRVQFKRHSDPWTSIISEDTFNAGEVSGGFSYFNLGIEYDVRIRAESGYAYSEWAEDQYTTPAPEVVDISNCQQLQDFDNDADNMWNTINLTQNIDCAPSELGDNNFVPLGSSDEWDGDYFYGEFDGNGHTISNLTIDDSNWGVGLFENVYFANLHDINFSGGSVNGIGEVGVLVGYAQNSIFNNITTSTTVTGSYYLGGIVGYIDYEDGFTTTLENLVSSAEIIGDQYDCGGIIGAFEIYDPNTDITVSNSHATGSVNCPYDSGGLIGTVYNQNTDDYYLPTSSITIEDSYATGEVNGDSSTGGLIGYIEVYNDGYYSEAVINLDGVYATGNVNSIGENTGGLIGYLDVYDATDSININDSYATGNVTSEDHNVGGLIGTANVYNEYEDNLDQVTLNITNTYSTGDVSGAGNIGGIIGRGEVSSDDYYNSPAVMNITSVYSTGKLSSIDDGSDVGGIIGDANIYDNSNSININRSYSSGDIEIGEGSDGGGIIGYAYVANDDDDDMPPSMLSIEDSFSVGNISGGYDMGGIIGYAETYNDGYEDSFAIIDIENTYAAGNVTATYDGAGGIVGYLYNYSSEGEVLAVTHSFAAGLVSAETGAYGIVGGESYDIEEDNLVLYNNWFVVEDSEEFTGPTQATFTELGGWDTVSSNSVFKGNSTNPPFTDPNENDEQVWNFDTTWLVVENNYPNLRDLPEATGSDSVELSSAEDGSAITIDQTGCETIDSASSVKESGLSVQDPTYIYPVGLAAFTLTGCDGTANITVTFTGDFNVNNVVIRKFNSVTKTYTTLTNTNSGLVLTKTTLNGKAALAVAYHIDDGGLLDQDGAEDGSITDPVGLATSVVAAPDTGFGGSQLQ